MLAQVANPENGDPNAGMFILLSYCFSGFTLRTVATAAPGIAIPFPLEK